MTTTLPSSEALGPDPLAIFRAWYAEAVEKKLPAPDALALATATADGKPSVRMVLYKGFEAGRLCLVTNYESRKARELAQNPWAALAFYWPGLDRQVRIEGRVERADAALSDRYFAGRDRESQLGAWASLQSHPVASRAELERALERERSRWQGRPVERPPHWGMLLLEPLRVEFWVSGPHRLHDRFAYESTATGWTITRLSP
jgi:pyridoxamine 5'-phosphate oxidase